MAALDRQVFLQVSEQLNENIRALSESMQRGAPPPALVTRARAEAMAGLMQLRSLGAPPGTLSANAEKVAHHLDLFVTLASSVSAAPALSQKLLAHLLEEQIEITTEEAAAAAQADPPGPPAPRPAIATPPSRPAAPAPLGGDRKPLTVGSLIGR